MNSTFRIWFSTPFLQRKYVAHFKPLDYFYFTKDLIIDSIESNYQMF